MITRVLGRFLRISPKKLGPIAGLIRNKKVDEAIYILLSVHKKGALILKNALGSALNNAKRLPEKDFAEEDLYISKVVVNPGPTLKRHRAMSMGRAGTIRKRTSHVLIELDAPRKAPEEIKAAKKLKKVRKPVKTRK